MSSPDDLLRYRTMVDHATLGIVVGQRGVIRYANRRCLDLLGVEAAAVGDRPMIEFVHPDDRVHALRQRERRELGDRVPAYEVRFLHADGRVLWVELDGVVIDWGGSPAALLFMKETSERHSMDENLRAALALREAMLETSTVGFCFLVDRRHLWLNRRLAQMLGYEVEELLGRDTRVQYLSDDDYQRIGGEAYAQIARDGRYTGQMRMRRKDGSTIWVQLDGCAVEQGTRRGTVWTYVDVTASRNAEDEMRRALEREREVGELKTRLLSMASHEFRTPLAAILSSAELVEHYADRIDPEDQRTIMADMVAAARRMQLMLDDMLTLGQAEAGRLNFQPRLVDPQAVCRRALAEVRSAHARHRITLEVLRSAPRELDERLVHHMLGNLLTNACKYSPDGSEVRMQLDCGPEAVRLSVQDSGIGIPESDLPHLFESFRRGGNCGQRPGSGLGLAIVQRCAALHGGTVTVVSTLGAGSTFTVTLPSVIAP